MYVGLGFCIHCKEEMRKHFCSVLPLYGTRGTLALVAFPCGHILLPPVNPLIFLSPAQYILVGLYINPHSTLLLSLLLLQILPAGLQGCFISGAAEGQSRICSGVLRSPKTGVLGPLC